MSQDNTPPRDGSPRDQAKDGVPPAPETPPAAGEQPRSEPLVPPSGLEPDPAPEIDPDFVPNPGEQPDPAAPPTDAQAPAYPAGYPGQEWQPEPHGDPVKRQRLVIGGIVVGVLVLIGVVIWVLLNLLGTRPEAAVTTPTATATPGPLPRDANAKDFLVGDCFADFDPNASVARAVACDTEHSAQLIGVHAYPTDDSFPGTNAMRDKGREVCKAAVAKLNAAAGNYVLLQQNVYPSPTSWDRGDRRVDCFIVVDSGNTIKEDLLQK
ncbi:septum formation family protein [Paenarthrobacter aurescens]|uniref:septum formation family protein n=1 Tax=Paenarthrobacter aurescens TaxID=43663 RepID=UPI0021BE2D7A|nr:septum formation family protein [Paenarthrobacter aurescens]MCT9870729.1 septum formation family protein [Paenarthrobacter aurescens]